MTNIFLPRVSQNWELIPPSREGDVSFDIPAGTSADTIVWKMDLPSSITVAERELQNLEIEIQSTRKVLKNIPTEIERMGMQHSKVSTGDLSFQLEQGASPEAEFFNLLNELTPTEAGLSFGLSGRGNLDWQKTAQEFDDSLKRIKLMLTRFALVETSILGNIIGRTVVSWSSKTDSSWQSGSRSDQYHLHQRSLQIALASRYLLLNMLVISAQSAARLSALIAIPGGAVMALPAIWKYITRVVDELEKYQSLTKQGVQEWPTN